MDVDELDVYDIGPPRNVHHVDDRGREWLLFVPGRRVAKLDKEAADAAFRAMEERIIAAAEQRKANAEAEAEAKAQAEQEALAQEEALRANELHQAPPEDYNALEEDYNAAAEADENRAAELADQNEGEGEAEEANDQ